MNDETEEMKRKLKDLDHRVSKLELILNENPDSSKENVSIRSFLKLADPKGEVNRTFAVCYFLENYDNLEFFNSNDVKDGYLKAREKVPNNISDKLYKNVKKNLLMEYKEKKDGLKAFVLTSEGLDYFDNIGE